MSKCAVKRGFVALRDCGNDASDTCVDCKRPICAEHTKVQSTDMLCVECFAKRQNAAAEREQKAKGGFKALSANEKGAKPVTARPDYDDWNDSSWAYRYRTHYYSYYDYSPFFYGHHNPYYDSYDVRSFDQYDQGAVPDDETAAGFYDS